MHLNVHPCAQPPAQSDSYNVPESQFALSAQPAIKVSPEVNMPQAEHAHAPGSHAHAPSMISQCPKLKDPEDHINRPAIVEPLQAFVTKSKLISTAVPREKMTARFQPDMRSLDTQEIGTVGHTPEIQDHHDLPCRHLKACSPPERELHVHGPTMPAHPCAATKPQELMPANAAPSISTVDAEVELNTNKAPGLTFEHVTHPKTESWHANKRQVNTTDHVTGGI